MFDKDGNIPALIAILISFTVLLSEVAFFMLPPEPARHETAVVRMKTVFQRRGELSLKMGPQGLPARLEKLKTRMEDIRRKVPEGVAAGSMRRDDVRNLIDKRVAAAVDEMVEEILGD